MKSSKCIQRLVIWLIPVALSILPVQSGPAPGLQVGVSAVDISPTVFPMQLRSGKSNYVHDPLHVRPLPFRMAMAER